MAEKDIMEKTLESHEDVFADIVNVLLFGGKKLIRAEDLQEKAPRAVYKADGKLRETERDVIKQWKKDNICIACIGLENQTASDPDMPLRVIGYDGAEYRAQLLKKPKVDRYPIITLVLYFGYDKHWEKTTALRGCLKIPKELYPYVNEHKINLFEIAYLTDEQLNMFESDFAIIADYFVQMRKNGDYQPPVRKIRHIQETLSFLSILTGDNRFEEACSDKEGEVRTMCEVLDRIDRGGEIRGMEQGMQQGMELGILTERERIIRLLYEEGNSVKQISSTLKMPEKAIQLIVGNPIVL